MSATNSLNLSALFASDKYIFPQHISTISIWSRGPSDHSHMGRSILAVLLPMILVISRVSINPIPGACQSVFITFTPHWPQQSSSITARSFAG